MWLDIQSPKTGLLFLIRTNFFCEKINTCLTNNLGQERAGGLADLLAAERGELQGVRKSQQVGRRLVSAGGADALNGDVFEFL